MTLNYKRKTYRDYLKENGIPLKYDFKNNIDMKIYRESQNKLYEEIYDNVEILPTSKILEIGCHYGGFVSYLNKRGIKPDAIDLDEEKIKILQTDKTLNANFFWGDAFNFVKTKPEHYDYIFMNFVLEHIKSEKTVDFLKAIQNSIKIKGVLFVTVPNMENPFNLRLRYCEPTHYNGFTTESLIWTFHTSGFDKIVCKDLYKYNEKEEKEIGDYFENISNLFKIRKFHGKFSESIYCEGTKIFNLKDIEKEPYDY